MATVTSAWHENGYEAELPLRVRRFVWVATGMFSAASLAIAFMGYFWSASFDGAASHFMASMVSGGLFGLTSFLKFGPSEA